MLYGLSLTVLQWKPLNVITDNAISHFSVCDQFGKGPLTLYKVTQVWVDLDIVIIQMI
jgi:hypothetical protein